MSRALSSRIRALAGHSDPAIRAQARELALCDPSLTDGMRAALDGALLVGWMRSVDYEADCPIQTMEHLWAVVNNHSPDWVYLRIGDTWAIREGRGRLVFDLICDDRQGRYTVRMCAFTEECPSPIDVVSIEHEPHRVHRL